MNKVTIHWFQQDLRLADNLALTLAANHEKVLPIYILDDEDAGSYAMGAASRYWLHHSLKALDASLNNTLSLYKGHAIDVFDDIMARYEVDAVYWNRCYEPWRIKRNADIKAYLKSKNILVKSCNGNLLWEPWTIKKSDGTSYRVFTPFYQKGCLQTPPPHEPQPIPKQISYHQDKIGSISLDNLKLLPKTRWDLKFEPHWHIGEQGASKRLKAFVETALYQYKEGRNFPAKALVSRLSSHLHFGEISAHQVWHDIRHIGENNDTECFGRELAWREFSHYLLYHHPELPSKNIQTKFDAFPWLEDSITLNAWQQGKTGIPMVDAGMRELWQTGYMHNRMRMIVGSFLVKNLRLHWHHGERWFWDTLVDADLANNSASWQWIAGCGADAAPYFRIFNPITQGQKFDPDGTYMRQFLPEIADLPNQYLFSPWTAPAQILKDAGVVLGKTYPYPIVDLKASRESALLAFKSLKSDNNHPKALGKA